MRSRTIRGTGCPFCTHRLVAPSESLATTHPDVAASWHPARNGTKTPADFTYGSHEEAWWQCPRFRTHVWRARIGSRTVMLAGCPSCAISVGKGARPKGKRAKRRPQGRSSRSDGIQKSVATPPDEERERPPA